MDDYENASGKREWKLFAGCDSASTSPKARAGHGMVRYRNRVYLFGGFSEPISDPYYGDDEEYEFVKARYPYAAGPHYNTVHEFNLDTRRWKELVTTSACGNMPRCRRSCSVVADGGSIYIFGGLTSTHELLNDMWEFNIEGCKWSQVEYRSGAPSGRYEHTAIVYMNRMYIFGGYDGKRKLNETYEFDLSEYTWSSPPSAAQNAPSRRCKHTAVLYSGSMYVLGGFQHFDHGNAARTDLHRLDLHTLTWNIVTMDDDEGPEALQLHTAVVSEREECMYVIGGKVKNEAGDAVLSTVLYSYHFRSQAWTALQIIKNGGGESCPETARQRHAAILGAGETEGCMNIFIFGGMDVGKRRFFEGIWELRRCNIPESIE